MKQRTARAILRDLIKAIERRDDPDEPSHEWQRAVDKLIEEANKLKENDNDKTNGRTESATGACCLDEAP
jgi:hypothetical protein